MWIQFALLVSKDSTLGSTYKSNFLTLDTIIELLRKKSNDSSIP